jgi:hypothetical protein
MVLQIYLLLVALQSLQASLALTVLLCQAPVVVQQQAGSLQVVTTITTKQLPQTTLT